MRRKSLAQTSANRFQSQYPPALCDSLVHAAVACHFSNLSFKFVNLHISCHGQTPRNASSDLGTLLNVTVNGTVSKSLRGHPVEASQEKSMPGDQFIPSSICSISSSAANFYQFIQPPRRLSHVKPALVGELRAFFC